MALSIGTKAPDFSLSCKSSEGIELVKLSDNFGKQNTVLLFFPMAFTRVCTTELCQTSTELDAYHGLNAVVCGISGDSPFALEVWAEKEKIGVPLLSDYEHLVTKAYGVAYETFSPDRNLPMGAWRSVPRSSSIAMGRSSMRRAGMTRDSCRISKPSRRNLAN